MAMTLREIINRLESLERRVVELEEERRLSLGYGPRSIQTVPTDGWPAYEEPRGDGNT